MRQLITNDVFTVSRILKKLDVLKDINVESDEKIALTIISKIVENSHMAQAEINSFLGDLAGMTGEEFGKLPIKDSFAIIQQFKELDGIGDFFKSVGQLMK